MFENILNQAESQLADHDELTMNHQGDSNELHKSNLSLSEEGLPAILNQSEFVHQTNGNNCSSQLQYLKLIGRSDNSLCANNGKPRCNRKSGPQHRTSQREPMTNHTSNQNGLCWTPLNDLSSESDFEDEFEYEEMLDQNVERYEQASVTELFVENLVDIEVEDFNCHQFRAAAAEAPVPMPRHHITSAAAKAESHQSTNNISDTNSPNAYKETPPAVHSHLPTEKNSHRQLPSGPCFTLSNQLKTLLHNSNRLKSQNYFFYWNKSQIKVL